MIDSHGDTLAGVAESRHPARLPPENEAGASAPTRPFRPWAGDEGPRFSDLLDILNPLQHIPLVGTLYRQITGDSISPAARAVGGTLFGGVIGLVAALGDTVIEQVSGRDTGRHLSNGLASLFRPSPEESGPILVAAHERAATPPADPLADRTSTAVPPPSTLLPPILPPESRLAADPLLRESLKSHGWAALIDRDPPPEPRSEAEYRTAAGLYARTERLFAAR